jgi:hypothetical protein
MCPYFMCRSNGGTLSTNPRFLVWDIAYRLAWHQTFLPLDTGSTWLFTLFCYHTPEHTDCTSGNLRPNREVSVAHSSKVGSELSAAHACNFEAAHCLLFICILMNCALRNISCVASNIGQGAKFEM